MSNEISKRSTATLLPANLVEQAAKDAAVVRAFDYMHSGHHALCRMEMSLSGAHIVEQGNEAMMLLSKPASPTVVVEFAERVVTEFNKYSLADTALFWRRFADGRYGKNFGAPGLPEIMQAWRTFLDERDEACAQIAVKKKHDPDVDDFAGVLQRTYEKNRAEADAREKRRQDNHKREDERKERMKKYIKEYRIYLSAMDSKGFARHDSEAMMPLHDYCVTRMSVSDIIAKNI